MNILPPIRIAIVDDEIDNIRIINKYLRSYPSQISIVGEFSNSQIAADYLMENVPDVLLLDIEMPELNGFQLIEMLNSNDVQAIYITGHEEYAIQAIKSTAVDYILKPFCCNELHEALNKARANLLPKFLLKAKAEEEKKPQTKLRIPGTKAYMCSSYSDIIYLKAIRGGYSMLYMLDGTSILATFPLNYYENILGDNGFFRSHKSHLINLRHVVSYEPNLLLTKLVDGSELDIAIRRKTLFLKVWSIYEALNSTEH